MWARNSAMVSSWKLDSSSTFQPSVARGVDHGGDRRADVAAHLRPAGRPRAECGRSGWWWWSCRSMPVMPMVRPLRNGAASSTSPITADAAPAGLFERREVGGHVRRKHDQVAAFEDRGVCTAKGMARRSSSSRGLGQFVERLQVGGAHTGALARQQLGRRHAGFLHTRPTRAAGNRIRVAAALMRRLQSC